MILVNGAAWLNFIARLLLSSDNAVSGPMAHVRAGLPVLYFFLLLKWMPHCSRVDIKNKGLPHSGRIRVGVKMLVLTASGFYR